MNNPSDFTELNNRLARIEAELRSLNRRLETQSPETNAAPAKTIKVQLDKSAQGRFPYTITVDGAHRVQKNITAIRASITLVYFLELIEIAAGKPTPTPTPERVRQVYAILRQPQDDEQLSTDSIRVGMNRAQQAFIDDFSEVLTAPLEWSFHSYTLSVVNSQKQNIEAPVDIILESSDEKLSAYLDQTLVTSPLSRLNRSKSLFVPTGENGQDRLLLELLDHDRPVRQYSVFYRPTIQSIPQDLAEKLGLNANRRKRIDVALTGYQSGRLHYTEIISRTHFKNFFTEPLKATTSNVEAEAKRTNCQRHLDHIITLLQTTPRYELILTDAFMPFYITTFESPLPSRSDRTVLFFQKNEEDNLAQVSTFALKDDSTFQNCHEKIVKWILAHPTTTSGRQEVIAEVSELQRMVM